MGQDAVEHDSLLAVCQKPVGRPVEQSARTALRGDQLCPHLDPGLADRSTETIYFCFFHLQGRAFVMAALAGSDRCRTAVVPFCPVPTLSGSSQRLC